MPHFKRRSRFRRRRRRPRRRRRRRRLMMDPEKKFIDLANQGAAEAVVNTGFSIILNSTAQGSATNQRIGLQQLNVMSNLSYRLQIGTTGVPTIVRLALLQFKQLAAQPLDLGDVWLNNATVVAPISNRNLVTAFQFRILWTRTHRLNLDQGSIVRRIMKPLRFKTRFSGQGGGVGAIESGALYLIGISDTGDVGAAPLLRWVSRLRFVG